ncbi:MAG TPA: histidine--tRNA ligase [Acidimicrobiia bacterium]|nr:histidine--tRNA ligase [Acidimicrobiia bacterium]
MPVAPTTPPGVLELLPAEQAVHDAMLDTIRAGYRRFGFVPIETPVFERSDVLLTKTGGETERQVYFVQSAGAREQGDEPDLALRFDLTVPLARYVAEHEHDLIFPFRRSQIQRVYRGERPQRGRYREFYQCDIDVIDRDTLSLRHDAEVAATMISILGDLGIGTVTLRLNNRRLMRSILTEHGIDAPEAQEMALREIDKLDKVGPEPVARTLEASGIDEVGRLLDLIGTRVAGASEIEAALADLPAVTRQPGGGADELAEVVLTMEALGVPSDSYVLDLAVARGLDYYTGTVYETVLDSHPELGSICSGGRYDDLAAQYTTTRLPGVGMSIGFTRLFWQLREAGLLPTHEAPVEVAIALIDDDGLEYALAVAGRLRAAGFSTETRMVPAKLGRQLKNADRAGIRFMVIAGEDERQGSAVTVRDLAAGDQALVHLDGLVEHLHDRLSRPGNP